MKQAPLLPIISFCLLLLSGCAKEGPNGPTGPAGPVGPSGPAYTGVISGHVSLYDQYGVKQYTGLGNVQITLKNGATTVTDSFGHYAFDSVATGIYNIAATTTGYGATVVSNLTYIKDSLNVDIKMSAAPSFNITTFKAYHNAGSSYDSLVISFPADTKIRSCIFFVSSAPSVSSLPAGYLLSYTKAIPANTTQALLRIPVADLNAVNVYYGEMTYFAAYSYVVNDASVYEDLATGKSVYTAVGTPLIDSATAP